MGVERIKYLYILQLHGRGGHDPLEFLHRWYPLWEVPLSGNFFGSLSAASDQIWIRGFALEFLGAYISRGRQFMSI